MSPFETDQMLDAADKHNSEIHRLESQLAAAKAEIVRLSGKTGFCLECERLAKDLEAVKTHHRYDLDQFRKCQDEIKHLREKSEILLQKYDALMVERNRLRKENELLCGVYCAGHVQEIKRLREALVKIYAHFNDNDSDIINECYPDMLRIAKAALDGEENEPWKEILYSGQCYHGEPMGQPCVKCNRMQDAGKA